MSHEPSADASVDDHQLPVRSGLGDDAVERRVKERLRLIRGNEDRDPGEAMGMEGGHAATPAHTARSWSWSTAPIPSVSVVRASESTSVHTSDRMPSDRGCSTLAGVDPQTTGGRFLRT